jgi:hypothetical protein
MSHSGSLNPNWRGGKTKHSKGYIYVWCPTHHRADKHGYVFEHILVAEKMLGRPLAPDEVVDHRDGDKGNNHPSNLSVLKKRQHDRLETLLRPREANGRWPRREVFNGKSATRKRTY